MTTQLFKGNVNALDSTAQKRYAGTWMNRPLALSALVVLSPVVLLNSLIAISSATPLFTTVANRDSAGRKVRVADFSRGLLRSTGRLFNVLKGEVSLCGYPLRAELSQQVHKHLTCQFNVPPGLVNALSLHKMTGLAVETPQRTLEKQFSDSSMGYCKLLLRGVLCAWLYGTKGAARTPQRLQLFGLNIDNVSMGEAVSWATGNAAGQSCQTGVFVNVNSVNLAATQPTLKADINAADRVFCDGSGMRIAAQAAGYQLKDNVNGTDLLPHLCEALQKTGERLYLLGAAPGVAEVMANNLKAQYPGLSIAGTGDGYFTQAQVPAVVQAINVSQADVLLVALGSPNQECWLRQYAPKLSCKRALAVGGLFDFYSGRISRAPLWLRELGLEWVWRLMQEPGAKFHRYVIGNPWFLIRVFLLKHAVKGGQS